MWPLPLEDRNIPSGVYLLRCVQASARHAGKFLLNGVRRLLSKEKVPPRPHSIFGDFCSSSSADLSSTNSLNLTQPNGLDPLPP